MAYGVSFRDPWVKVNSDDYVEEALEDGTQLRAKVEVVDLVSGLTEYWGVLEVWEDEDD